MSEGGSGKKRITEGIEIIVDEAESAVKSAIRRSGAEALSGNLKETIQSALSSRKNVVMVRLNQDSLERLDELVEAEVVSSRSEASAFLIGKGIKASEELFSRISEKIEVIRAARQELRDLLDPPSDQEAESPPDTEQQEATEGPERGEQPGPNRIELDDKLDPVSPAGGGDATSTSSDRKE